MQELRNMVAHLSHRLGSFEDNRTSLSRMENDNMERSLLRNDRSKTSYRLETFGDSRASLSITEDNNMERSSLRNDRSKTTVERSLSPVLIRNKGRNRQLSPMTRSYKKTLHVCYIFIIKIYLLFNL
ncbi:MAG: hypothetical protein JO131_00445 [Gammaproteobacteria bacterium]|jgi:hypothetical protein|nr:hypothetical protein [Gammaproteobacteria bacterium]